MTQGRVAGTHGGRAFAATFAALAAVAALAAGALAEPRPLDARVVWAYLDHVYMAAPDSLMLASGDLLTFVYKKKVVATGEAIQLPARDLAGARITSGSLLRIKRLDRVKILAERPAMQARAVLRIGAPGRGRENLLFACDAQRLRSPVAGAYQTDSLAENSYRLVRTTAVQAPWPDTILVRLFAEAADEEIALERGDLDVAMFWPGEASSRLRADPRWQEPLFALRGVLAAIGTADAPAPDLTPHQPELRGLSDALFRGDLMPVRVDVGSMPPNVRFDVDPACPGREALERYLRRANTAGGESHLHVRLGWVESSEPGAGTRVLFHVRCPLACGSSLRPYVKALGPDALAGMIECPSAGRAP